MHLNRTRNKITANYEIKARKEKELPQKDRKEKISKYSGVARNFRLGVLELISSLNEDIL